MRDFPQELVDLVIDKLAESVPPAQISDYSTISRQWVEQTQKYHFDTVLFRGSAGIRRWRDTIEPNPSGVSRHIRRIRWRDLDTLMDFYNHICAFTRVVDMGITDCLFIHEGFQLAFLVPLGQRLERLDVTGESAILLPFAHFLSTLPHLRRLRARFLRIQNSYDDSARSLPTIPCFESANSLDLSLREYLPGNISWIPPTARFCDLRVDVECISVNHDLVNQWIRSSAQSLERFTVYDDGSDSTSAPRPIIPNLPL